MTEQENISPSGKEVPDAAEPTDLPIKVERADLQGKGGMAKYRKVVAMRRGLTDFDHAQPEDVDEAISFIADHVIEPENRREVEHLLWNEVTIEQTLDLLDAIIGRDGRPNQ